MKKPSPYAHILRAIADGEVIQWLRSGDWIDQDVATTLREIGAEDFYPDRYRIKPRTIRVGEADVPGPMQEAPVDGMPYWVINTTSQDFIGNPIWRGDSTDRLWLSRGLCYSNPADAEIAGRAIAALFMEPKS